MTPTTLRDSRRLPGPNLLWDRPGAVIEVTLRESDGDRVVAAWEAQARRMLDTVGWNGEATHARRFPGGASLALSAPIDALYGATEVNEWAWAAAEEIAAGGAEPPVEEAAARLRGLIADESRPPLVALRDAAHARGVTFLHDHKGVSVGSGAGSITWPPSEVPSPDTVHWDRVHDVPIVLITGTNGKTTTARLLAAIVRAAGTVPGLTSTDGLVVGGEWIDRGDWTGPGGARAILRDRRVGVAVLETARGGILRRGLAVERADAAIATNVAEDHFGEWGIFDLRALAETKFTVGRVVRAGGRFVLNADDGALVEELKVEKSEGRIAAPVVWLSLDPKNPVVRDHVAAGGDACVAENGALVLIRGGRREVIERVENVPLTFGGAARHNVANVLGVIALATAIGLPRETIAHGLRDFSGTKDQNPGRGNLYELGGVKVLVDFAHNPHGMNALAVMAEALPAKRRLLVLGQAGDRDDVSIIEFARSAWRMKPDRTVLKEMEIYLRGRAKGEVTAMLKAELLRVGAPAESLVHADSEMEAARDALAWARPGDLLLLPIYAERAEVLALMERLIAERWSPGKPLP